MSRQDAFDPPVRVRAAFAVAVLALGMAAAWAGYAVFGAPDDRGLVDPPLWPPRWGFWAVWILLYPPTGVAFADLWSRRRLAPGGMTAAVLLALSLGVGLAWVPVVQASGSRLVMPLIMDAAAAVAGLVAWVAAWRVSRTAALWLLPINAWGLATSALKLWRLVLNT